MLCKLLKDLRVVRALLGIHTKNYDKSAGNGGVMQWSETLTHFIGSFLKQIHSRRTQWRRALARPARSVLGHQGKLMVADAGWGLARQQNCKCAAGIKKHVNLVVYRNERLMTQCTFWINSTHSRLSGRTAATQLRCSSLGLPPQSEGRDAGPPFSKITALWGVKGDLAQRIRYSTEGNFNINASVHAGHWPHVTGTHVHMHKRPEAFVI